ncbi:hypothetical protein AB1Y20_021551 [Prymnesium parvum]|uniref:Uncharacterized protein n=1 Tax=Prymnesium parvum TaxID=97485 RepID=A0AB34JJY0_PRYPA
MLDILPPRAAAAGWSTFASPPEDPPHAQAHTPRTLAHPLPLPTRLPLPQGTAPTASWQPLTIRAEVRAAVPREAEEGAARGGAAWGDVADDLEGEGRRVAEELAEAVRGTLLEKAAAEAHPAILWPPVPPERWTRWCSTGNSEWLPTHGRHSMGGVGAPPLGLVSFASQAVKEHSESASDFECMHGLSCSTDSSPPKPLARHRPTTAPALPTRKNPRTDALCRPSTSQPRSRATHAAATRPASAHACRPADRLVPDAPFTIPLLRATSANSLHRHTRSPNASAAARQLAQIASAAKQRGPPSRWPSAADRDARAWLAAQNHCQRAPDIPVKRAPAWRRPIGVTVYEASVIAACCSDGQGWDDVPLVREEF